MRIYFLGMSFCVVSLGVLPIAQALNVAPSTNPLVAPSPSSSAAPLGTNTEGQTGPVFVPEENIAEPSVTLQTRRSSVLKTYVPKSRLHPRVPGTDPKGEDPSEVR